MALLAAAANPDPNPAKGGSTIEIVDDMALVPDAGPAGTRADIGDQSENRARNGFISYYVVGKGDTLSQIATMFDVSVNSIAWANDFGPKDALHEGQELLIFPIDGVLHTVKSGGTIADVAKIYKADAREIANFNRIAIDTKLKKGDELFVPGGEMPARPTTYVVKTNTAVSAGGYYRLKPCTDCKLTQGAHGRYGGIDYGAPTGTPIIAVEAGVVVTARDYGWNGGFGQYVVIQHANGKQTLYAHASAVLVARGQSVEKGQAIARIGSTGKSTGSHVHYEVR